ncbi:MAG: hypothetical protein ILA04_02245 [Prevotella sp.]|nr:hypothetical protein [Prevotella sp.]
MAGNFSIIKLHKIKDMNPQASNPLPAHREFNPFVVFFLKFMIAFLLVKGVRLGFGQADLTLKLLGLSVVFWVIASIFLVCRKNKYGVYMIVLLILSPLLLLVRGSHDLGQVVAIMLPIFLVFAYVAAVLCIRKDGRSAWRVLFPRKD